MVGTLCLFNDMIQTGHRLRDEIDELRSLSTSGHLSGAQIPLMQEERVFYQC